MNGVPVDLPWQWYALGLMILAALVWIAVALSLLVGLRTRDQK